jgi:hypothetical protein
MGELVAEQTSVESLTRMHAEFQEGLAEILEMVRHPKGRVIDPASLATAEELLTSTLAVLRAPGSRDTTELTREVNLAYAVTLAGIDLVKSHTDVPRVPPPRPAK